MDEDLVMDSLAEVPLNSNIASEPVSIHNINLNATPASKGTPASKKPSGKTPASKSESGTTAKKPDKKPEGKPEKKPDAKSEKKGDSKIDKKGPSAGKSGEKSGGSIKEKPEEGKKPPDESKQEARETSESPPPPAAKPGPSETAVKKEKRRDSDKSVKSAKGKKESSKREVPNFCPTPPKDDKKSEGCAPNWSNYQKMVYRVFKDKEADVEYMKCLCTAYVCPMLRPNFDFKEMKTRDYNEEFLRRLKGTGCKQKDKEKDKDRDRDRDKDEKPHRDKDFEKEARSKDKR